MLNKKIISFAMALSIVSCGTSFIPTNAYASTTNDIATVSRSTSSFTYDIAKFYNANDDLISEAPDSSSDKANLARYNQLRSAGRIVSRTHSIVRTDYEEGGTGNYCKIVRYYVTYN
jgi:hypothetical protein